MQVVSLCALRTGSLAWQRSPGVWALTVFCKGTFTLAPGESVLSQEQDDPSEDDNYWNDDPARSLYLPSDHVPMKLRADVLLVGHAFAPRGEPVHKLSVRMIVGQVDKALEVHRDRAWTQERILVEGPRFAKMPLRYERAAGGPESTNPIGVRMLDAAPDMYGKIHLPNLQPTGQLVSDPSDLIEPVGLGPLAGGWPARAGRLGPIARTWAFERRYDEPFPPDLDATYFNSAPLDQQTEYLRDNERIVLQNLHPEHPRLVTSLPGIHPVAFAERRNGVEPLALACDTLWIDTDRGVCTATWRTIIEQPSKRGRVLVGMERPGERVGYHDLERLARAPEDADRSFSAGSSRGADKEQTAVTTTEAIQVARARAAAKAAGRSSGGTDPAIQRQGPAMQDDLVVDTVATAGGSAAASRSALPFSAATSRAEDALPFRAAPSGAAPARKLASMTLHDIPVPPEAGPSWLGPAPSAEPVGAHDHPSSIERAPSWVGPAPSVAPPPPAFVQPPAPQPVAAPMNDSPWASGSMVMPSPAVVPPPSASIPSSSHDANAVSAGVVAASNAAAHAQPWTAPAAVPEPSPSVPSAIDKRAHAPADVIDLLWFEPKSVPRLRQFWEEVLVELEFEEEDPKQELAGASPEEARDRREAFGVLSDGVVQDASGVSRALLEAVGERGRFTPPLVLVGGDLVLPFDELEQLKATVTAITPLIGGDKKLKESVDAVNELVQSGYLQSSSSVVERLTQQLRDLFRDSGKSVHTGYLETHTERILLEQRRYQRRTLFGELWIRGVLVTANGEAPIPTYLPDALAQKLPMMTRMRARIVGEIHLQQDQYEAHPHALKAVALGRVVPLDVRKRR